VTAIGIRGEGAEWPVKHWHPAGSGTEERSQRSTPCGLCSAVQCSASAEFFFLPSLVSESLEINAALTWLHSVWPQPVLKYRFTVKNLVSTGFIENLENQ
jgi:hypothetical protein